MSYARFSDGDVYVFDNGDGIECCGCKLQPDRLYIVTETRAEMIEHLLAHRAAGHDVPQYAIDRLQMEIDFKQTEWGVP